MGKKRQRKLTIISMKWKHTRTAGCTASSTRIFTRRTGGQAFFRTAGHRKARRMKKRSTRAAEPDKMAYTIYAKAKDIEARQELGWQVAFSVAHAHAYVEQRTRETDRFRCPHHDREFQPYFPEQCCVMPFSRSGTHVKGEKYPAQNMR